MSKTQSTPQTFSLQQYLNIVGVPSRDRWVANKIFQDESDDHSLIEWTQLMLNKNIFDTLPPSLHELISSEDISRLIK